VLKDSFLSAVRAGACRRCPSAPSSMRSMRGMGRGRATGGGRVDTTMMTANDMHGQTILTTAVVGVTGSRSRSHTNSSNRPLQLSSSSSPHFSSGRLPAAPASPSARCCCHPCREVTDSMWQQVQDALDEPPPIDVFVIHKHKKSFGNAPILSTIWSCYYLNSSGYKIKTIADTENR
jgi:hypothetical protein